MKRLLFFLGITIIASSFVTQKRYVKLRNTTYSRGEKLTYRLHYGFFNAGTGTVEVDKKLYRVNQKICTKHVIKGKSVGAFAAILKIRDTWISYVDTATMLPQKSYRDIKEGKYVYKESVFFNPDDTLARIEWEKRDGVKHVDTVYTPQNVQDIVSGFYFLRNIDYSKVKVGEIIEVWAFFDDKHYEFQVQFKGRDVVKTDIGKVRALRLVPIMPDNSLFDGEDSIEMWISDDGNKIPLKCRAEMFVGAVELDLKKVEGLKHPINYK